MKRNILLFVLVLALFLVACSGTDINKPLFGGTNPQAAPTAAPTSALSGTKLTVSGTCSLTGGSQLKVDQRVSTDWQWNPNAVEEGLRGCNFLVEGRKSLVSEHHIWVLGHGQLNYIDTDGKFHCLECSVWAFPADWNMDDFSTEKPPIGAEFVNAKRINMKVNNYDWPIVVHTADGQTRRFNRGDSVQNVQLPNNCSFDQPQKINVTGIYNSSSGLFNASIGAEGCKTVAIIDGQRSQWPGAKDNVTFRNITAFLMPSAWTQAQVDTWTPPR